MFERCWRPTGAPPATPAALGGLDADARVRIAPAAQAAASKTAAVARTIRFVLMVVVSLPPRGLVSFVQS
jgi:hypothetical protein